MPACPACKKSVRKKARNCPHCQVSLKPAQKRGGDAIPTTSPMPLSATSFKGRIVLLAVVALFVVGAYSVFRNSVFNARTAAQRTQVKNHLKLLGLALHNFHDNYSTFPPIRAEFRGGGPLHSWMTYLLPYVGEARIYNNLDLTKPWDETPVQSGFQQQVQVYQNPMLGWTRPDALGFGGSHLAANSAIIQPEKGLAIRDITDGTSQTMLVGTVNAGFQAWADPSNTRDARAGFGGGPKAFGAAGPGPVMVLMADGSVKYFSPELDPAIARNLGEPRDGARINIDAVAEQ